MDATTERNKAKIVAQIAKEHADRIADNAHRGPELKDKLPPAASNPPAKKPR
jgi:hypothetical protein